MCAVLPAIAIGAAAVSTAYSAYSSYQQGKSARAMGDRNAALSNMAAADAEQRGALEASKIRSKGVRIASRQRAMVLAGGLAGEGFTSVTEGTIYGAGLDAETARNNGAREAWGYRNQATASAYEGRLAQSTANMNMAGSILSGAASIAAASASAASRAAAARTASPLATTGASTSDFTLKPSTSLLR